MGIEKVIPGIRHLPVFLHLLARSGTGQKLTTYTHLFHGSTPGRKLYVIILDNGRTNILKDPAARMSLFCIRCGACLNACPVYRRTGGWAYGWVYPGPIGAVLTPAFLGIEQAAQLPNASTFCGRCEAVCPMRIPLPKMLRHWREREFERHLTPRAARWGLGVWAFIVRRPRLYHAAMAVAAPALKIMAGRRGRLRRLPLAGGWTDFRDLPAPEGGTFHGLWADRRTGRAA
jgi:L-lactate dehydrogenase complex protein LldF